MSAASVWPGAGGAGRLRRGMRAAPARLLTPLRRDGPKGSGRFRAVSWDEALAEIAQRLAEVAGGPGAHTILAAHYTGTFALLGYHFPNRLIRRLGAREVDPDTICNKAGHVALEYLYGTSLDGFDPRSAAVRRASWSGAPTLRPRRRISMSTGCPRRRGG